jgi:hypothetical protein
MRYRIFQNDMFVGTFDDIPAYHEAFTGDNPNSPMKGDKITFNNTQYVIKWYIEHDSQSFTENEFHEKENDWFVDIIVN